MRFTVVWTKNASDAVAELWLLARNRKLVTEQVHALDRQLSTNAHLCGSASREGIRIISIDSLYVTYTVDMQDCLVEVVGLGLYK
jgi:hypothetical protein